MRIGLTQRVLFHRGRAYDSLEHSWYEFLQGHTLVSIANRLPTSYPDLDALIITGGDDHPVRNQVEHELIDCMLACNIPVIGICHGCQLLTTKLGGTVVVVDGHMDSYHEVEYHGQQHLVNSYHSLRIEQPPPGALVLAHDPDGYAEAWIMGRTAGVMWHPERQQQPWWPSEVAQLLNS
jgi:N5-(cytidine 5'-diphosphoramidyl)-L-glutamine hydrolase